MMDMKLDVLGESREEARLWDLIIEGRALVSKTKMKRDVGVVKSK